MTQQPDVISFGGGLPAPELFPTEAIARCAQEVMELYGAAALQYSVTEGIPELRSWVAERLTRRIGRVFEGEEILIVNGSQQGLDLIGKVLLDPGDHIVLERPSYLGAIQAFDAYQARYLSVETDDDGIVPEALEHLLSAAKTLPKFLYLVPNFQNPTGRTLAAGRREAIVRICERFDLPIVEDDPYGELRFDGHDLTPLSAYSKTGTVIYCGTGSKIVAPGLRVAWLAVEDHDLREKIVLAKQGADLQPATFTQYVFHRYVRDERQLAEHIERIKATYRIRRDVMAAMLREHLPAETHFITPQGGMFLWASVPGIDTAALLRVSAEQRVVFVPGVNFYPERDEHDGMRLNFSNAPEEKIRVGVERLGHAVTSMRDAALR
ncbi:MAG TPA: PLP-dependent aminotransferase family protein [Candidatus Acidoferrales bacterium]|nr:PLP-dependent aminotransferase family protein [Candidatus Acidoferrales bacterium]